MSGKSKGHKKYKAVNPDLSTEQQRALAQFQRGFQKAYPVILGTQAVAQRLWKDLIDADEWRIAETVVPEHMKDHVQQQPEQWSVGHAKVNYVDHIEVKE